MPHTVSNAVWGGLCKDQNVIVINAEMGRFAPLRRMARKQDSHRLLQPVKLHLQPGFISQKPRFQHIAFGARPRIGQG